MLECFTLHPDKPNCAGLVECYCTLAMYESASVPLFLEEIMPSSGGGVAERLMSTLAYGWVERCSNIAGCGTSSSQANCSCLC